MTPTMTPIENVTDLLKDALKANIHSGFFLTVRNGFYCSLEISLTRERFTCSRARNKIDRNGSKKKVELNPTFFLNRRGSFRNTFFFIHKIPCNWSCDKTHVQDF